MKNKIDNGVITYDGQKVAYIYICGIRPVHEVIINDNIKLLPVKASPKPDDMIDNVMKFGNADEFELGILIATLRKVTAELEIKADNAKSLAILTWNAQTICLQISAMFNCEVVWYFQSNESAEKFNSKTKINMIYPNMLKFPSELTIIDDEKCHYLEENILAAMELDDDQRYSNAVNALWGHRFHPRPSIQLSIIWGGIESLFLIEKNIKKELSLAISHFLCNDERMIEDIKLLYEKRSKSVHEMKNSDDQGLKNSVKLLHQLIWKCIEKKSVPNIEELL